MNSRVKTLFGLVVLVVALLFTSSLTRADEASAWPKNMILDAEVQKASSGQGEVLSSYPFFLNHILKTLFSWDPREEHKKASFEILQLIKVLTVDFDVSDTNHFRKVWFRLTPELKVRGLLALQDLEKSRPLVILRMGIHGNVDELLAERFLFKALYEDLKVNVLVLESLTSHAFLQENAAFSFGGVEEGLHTFLIMQKLRSSQSEISKLISSFHLLGVSMGAQGVFFTSLLDQYNLHQVKAQMNLCPLINFKETFAFHTLPTWRNVGLDFWNILRLRNIRQKKDFPYDWFDYGIDLFYKKPHFTMSVFQYLNQYRRQPLLSVADIEAQMQGIRWPEGLRKHLSDGVEDFYQLNHFWPYYKGVKTPTFVMTTPKDPLVTNELNADLIFSGKQEGDFSSLKYQKLDRGIHCGFPPVYSWNEIIEWLKEGLKL